MTCCGSVARTVRVSHLPGCLVRLYQQWSPISQTCSECREAELGSSEPSTWGDLFWHLAGRRGGSNALALLTWLYIFRIKHQAEVQRLAVFWQLIWDGTVCGENTEASATCKMYKNARVEFQWRIPQHCYPPKSLKNFHSLWSNIWRSGVLL